jgi:predicted SAM-dependent methyltransferase
MSGIVHRWVCAASQIRRRLLDACLKRIGRVRALRVARSLVKDGGPICLELGAGSRKGRNGWVTLDIIRGCDVYWDLREGIPFPENSVSQIYASHLLEHFDSDELLQLLHSCLRVLRSGGTLSVGVPNAKLYMSAYMQDRDLDRGQCFRFERAYKYFSRIDYVNYVAYMAGQHKHMFDEENMVAVLKAAGFRNAQRRDFDASIDPAERRYQSIYAIGEK